MPFSVETVSVETVQVEAVTSVGWGWPVRVLVMTVLVVREVLMVTATRVEAVRRGVVATAAAVRAVAISRRKVEA
jgi:hypothetical protein